MKRFHSPPRRRSSTETIVEDFKPPHQVLITRLLDRCSILEMALEDTEKKVEWLTEELHRALDEIKQLQR